MNCKFHPTAEAVTKCAKCGKPICFYCDQKAFFRTEDEDKKPLCLECSLKKAKIEFEAYEEFEKEEKKRRKKALIFWFIGLPLIALGGIGLILMIAAAIIYMGKSLIASEEQTFMDKVKGTLFVVLAFTLILPFVILKDSSSDKKNIKRVKGKLQEVQAAAFEVWTKNAEQGDSEAIYNLGYLYLHGDGVAKDCEKAIELLEKSANQGNAEAQCSLGYIYIDGDGVPKDFTKAFEWLMKAAKQGNLDAFFAIGSAYSEGEGVPQDDVKAVEWWSKAAERGHAGSQCALGLCYKDGTGVPQDMAKAFNYWKMAAEQGYKTAEELLAENS